MSWGKHFVYAWITYFLAFCGIGRFYFDVRTGKVIKSPYLCYYSRVFILLILCTFPVMIQSYVFNPAWFHTESKIISVCIMAYPVILLISILSCMFCVERWQLRIIRMIEDLLKMEDFRIGPNYCATPADKSYLHRLFWLRFIIIMPRTAVLLMRIINKNSDVYFFLNSFVTRVMRGGLYFLVFSLNWQIYVTFLNLQLCLEHLYLATMPMARKQAKLLELHRMYYRLIHMINDLSLIFKYPMFCCLLQLICNTCLSGYLLIRYIFGKPSKSIASKTDPIVLILCIVDVLEFYLHASIAHLTAKLHDSTHHILRYPYPNLDLLERSVSISGTWVKSKVIYNILE
nr:uncharacterized protein LOC116651929 isoform X2 [Drosophila virilis]